MSSMNIAMESELFCTNLNYSLSDDNMDKMIGDPGNKSEDAVLELNKKINDLIK